MTTIPTAEERAERLNHLLTTALYRIAGLVLFALGISYWVRLVGLYPGALWRFDLMPLWWKMAAPALAVLCPVAGVGLWMTVSWGVVIWVLVAIIEAIMHFGLPDLFGGANLWLFLHLFGLSMLGILNFIKWSEVRRRLSRAG